MVNQSETTAGEFSLVLSRPINTIPAFLTMSFLTRQTGPIGIDFAEFMDQLCAILQEVNPITLKKAQDLCQASISEIMYDKKDRAENLGVVSNCF